jgi:hypothetical protein
VTKIFLLLIIFQLKHFFCDYPLQRPWMLGKFKPGWGFVVPLGAHALVHGLLTWVIVLYLRPSLGWQLALFDFCVHFTMDRIKASPKLMGRWKPLSPDEYRQAQFDLKLTGSPHRDETASRKGQAKYKLRGNRLFWDALGLDQMVHHLTHYVVIWMLVR